MKKSALLGVALAFVSSLAIASSCPKEMKLIDAALPAAKLDAGKMAEVKKLRAEGEEQHKAGKHADSMASLGKAKALLGIK